MSKEIRNKGVAPGLYCPTCLALLGTDADSACENDHSIQLREGIPSFTDATHFDAHWDKNLTVEIPASKREVATSFLSPLSQLLRDNNGLRILDAGCGDGVHIDVIDSEFELQRDDNMAVDISLSALLATQMRISDKWQLVHADIAALPFQEKSFDVVFSYGVIAYTTAPQETFKELVRVLRPGGVLGIWVYPKAQGIGGVAFSAVRKLCQWTGSIGTNIIASSIVPFLGLLPTSSKLSLANASWKQCKEVVMVNIAPTQLFFPTRDEIITWFHTHDVEIIEEQQDSPIAIWGRLRSD